MERMLPCRAGARLFNASVMKSTGRKRRVRRATSRFALIVSLCLICVATGCAGDEKKAQRLYREAKEQVEANDLVAAIEALEDLVERYPVTETAGRARKDLVLYRGLVGAVHRHPVESAQELVVRIAKAIQKYRSRHRTWPETLDDLRPDLVSEAPVDPWGRVLRYARKPGGGYVLLCYGADGVAGGRRQDQDFYVEDGEFVKEPSQFP